MSWFQSPRLRFNTYLSSFDVYPCEFVWQIVVGKRVKESLAVYSFLARYVHTDIISSKINPSESFITTDSELDYFTLVDAIEWWIWIVLVVCVTQKQSKCVSIFQWFTDGS